MPQQEDAAEAARITMLAMKASSISVEEGMALDRECITTSHATKPSGMGVMDHEIKAENLWWNYFCSKGQRALSAASPTEGELLEFFLFQGRTRMKHTLLGPKKGKTETYIKNVMRTLRHNVFPAMYPQLRAETEMWGRIGEQVHTLFSEGMRCMNEST